MLPEINASVLISNPIFQLLITNHLLIKPILLQLFFRHRNNAYVQCDGLIRLVGGIFCNAYDIVHHIHSFKYKTKNSVQLIKA